MSSPSGQKRTRTKTLTLPPKQRSAMTTRRSSQWRPAASPGHPKHPTPWNTDVEWVGAAWLVVFLIVFTVAHQLPWLLTRLLLIMPFGCSFVVTNHHKGLYIIIPGHTGPFGPKLLIGRTTTTCCFFNSAGARKNNNSFFDVLTGAIRPLWDPPR